MKRKSGRSLPDVEALENELRRVRHKRHTRRVLRNTLFTLAVVAAVAVLIVTIWMPVLQIYGSSMTPTVSAEDIVVAVKAGEYHQGDVVGLYIGNKLLVKRIIAEPGSWVNITEDGTVFVDSIELDEPYVTEKALGDCNIELPYQVPEDYYFVLGDHRSISSDSRNTAVGPISEDAVVGRIIFCVWPFSRFGAIQ